MRPSLVVASCLLAVLILVRPASAVLRSPQVPILGTVLQDYLNSVGENIAVGTDQQDIQTFAAPVSNNPTFTIQLECGPKAPDTVVGFYNPGAATPTLYPIFPAVAGPRWFAVVSFRTAPTRAVVNLFDGNAALVGTQVYLGAGRAAFAYYLSSPDGVVYQEDALNPGSHAQFVVYAGTEVNSGSWWICAEQTPVAGGGSNQDFFDAVLFNESSSCNCSPTLKTTWGTLKARYR